VNSPLANTKATNVIQSNSLNLTRYAGVGAAIVVVLNSINPAADKLLGNNPSSTDRVALYIAVIASWALIAVADICARAYATAHKTAVADTAPATGVGRESGPATVIALAPPQTARSLDGVDQSGFLAVAIRVQSDKTTEFLLIKPGQAPVWVTAANVQLMT